MSVQLYIHFIEDDLRQLRARTIDGSRRNIVFYGYGHFGSRSQTRLQYGTVFGAEKYLRATLPSGLIRAGKILTEICCSCKCYVIGTG